MADLVFATRGVAEVLAEQERLRQAGAQQRSEVQKLNAEYQTSDKELRKLQRIAGQYYRENETAQESYTRKLTEAKAALQGNVNEVELLRRVETKLKLEYARTADAHRVKTKEIVKDIGNYATKLADAGRVQQGLFGEASIARLSAFAGRLGAILAPLTGFARAIEQGDQLLRQYGSQAITAAKAAGGLAQLAGGDPAKLAALQAASKQSYREGGFTSLDEAYRLTFELESGGILRDRAFLSRLQAASVDDAAQVAKNTALVAAAFGRPESGYTAELVSKGLAAAGPATGANLGDILQGVAFASGSAKQLRLSDEEVFALVSRIAEVTGSGVEAGTRVNAIFRSFIKKGFADDPSKKQTLAQMLEDLRSRGLEPSGLIEFLGRQEAAQAFDVGQDVEAFQKRLQEIHAAQRDKLAEKVVESAFTLPDVAARRQVQAAKAEAQLALEEQALRRQRIDAESERLTAELQKELGKVPTYIVDSVQHGGSLFGIPLPGVRSFIPDFLEDRGIYDPSAQTGPNEMDRMAQQLDDQKRIQQQQLDELRSLNKKDGGLVGTTE